VLAIHSILDPAPVGELLALAEGQLALLIQGGDAILVREPRLNSAWLDEPIFSPV
jgi:hypothetical protein